MNLKAMAVLAPLALVSCTTGDMADRLSDAVLGSTGFDYLVEVASSADTNIDDEAIKGAERVIDKYCSISLKTRTEVFRKRLDAARAARGESGGYLLICPDDPIPVTPAQ